MPSLSYKLIFGCSASRPEKLSSFSLVLTSGPTFYADTVFTLNLSLSFFLGWVSELSTAHSVDS